MAGSNNVGALGVSCSRLHGGGLLTQKICLPYISAVSTFCICTYNKTESPWRTSASQFAMKTIEKFSKPWPCPTCLIPTDVRLECRWTPVTHLSFGAWPAHGCLGKEIPPRRLGVIQAKKKVATPRSFSKSSGRSWVCGVSGTELSAKCFPAEASSGQASPWGSVRLRYTIGTPLSRLFLSTDSTRPVSFQIVDATVRHSAAGHPVADTPHSPEPDCEEVSWTPGPRRPSLPTGSICLDAARPGRSHPARRPCPCPRPRPRRRRFLNEPLGPAGH